MTLQVFGKISRWSEMPCIRILKKKASERLKRNGNVVFAGFCSCSLQQQCYFNMIITVPKKSLFTSK